MLLGKELYISSKPVKIKKLSVYRLAPNQLNEISVHSYGSIRVHECL